MKTRTLKISTRLALAFGLTILLGLTIATFAIWEMRYLAANLDEVAKERMVKVRELTAIANNQTSMALTAHNIVLREPTAQENGADLREIKDFRAENARMIEHLEKTIVQPNGRELFKVILDNRARYNAEVDKSIALAQQGKRQEAAHILLGEAHSTQMTMAKAANDSIELQQHTAERLANEAATAASRDGYVLFALVAVLALLGTATAWVITRSLTRALGAEPGEVSLAVQSVAAGDLVVQFPLRAGDQSSTMSSVCRMQSDLRAIVSAVRGNADSVATASAEIAQGNVDLSSRTEQQASALQETAAAMEQLGTTVQRNAENARQASQLAVGASSVAVRGGEVVGAVVQAMEHISSNSSKIAEITSVINEIAFQTNILALNAAVEAARAGEQGRGFSVVASEVRNLAQRSASAAKDIKQLIETSVTRVEEGSVLVSRAGETMQEIVTSVGKVAEIVGEISSASAEQSTGVAQIGEAVSQMDQATQQNAALVEQSAAAAASLRTQAQQLVHAVSAFIVDDRAPTSPEDAASRSTVTSATQSTPRRHMANSQLPREPSGSALLGPGTARLSEGWAAF